MVDKMNKYRCCHCKKVVNRASEKRWVKSFCEATGRTVHLVLVTSEAKSQSHLYNDEAEH